MACCWAPACCVLTDLFSVHIHPPGSLPHLIRTSVLLDEAPTLVTSSSLIYLLKETISKYSHVEVKAPMYEFRGNTVQSVTHMFGQFTWWLHIWVTSLVK